MSTPPVQPAPPASAARSAIDLLRAARTGATVQVEPWPTEHPLFALVLSVSLLMWLVIAVSILGLVYVALIAVGLLIAQAAYVAYVRGSAVRLGPDQFPELHARVVELATRVGIHPLPEAYVMQAGGNLNAFAMRFLRSRMVILFSELLDACGDDLAARDDVIGHELGHIHAGHLNWQWLLAPGKALPFLGNAYSRACEYTCDRYGAALCGDREGSLRGLAILAAGGRLGPRVNLKQLALQRTSLDTGWMTIGKWLSTHPPLCDRVAALSPSLAGPPDTSWRGPLRAALIMLVAAVLPALILVTIAVTLALRAEDSATSRQRAPRGAFSPGIR